MEMLIYVMLTLVVSGAMFAVGRVHGYDETIDKIGNLMQLVENINSDDGTEKARWILHDVQCKKQYECSHCHTRFVEEENKYCDEWLYCPVCGKAME